MAQTPIPLLQFIERWFTDDQMPHTPPIHTSHTRKRLKMPEQKRLVVVTREIHTKTIVFVTHEMNGLFLALMYGYVSKYTGPVFGPQKNIFQLVVDRTFDDFEVQRTLEDWGNGIEMDINVTDVRLVYDQGLLPPP